MRIALIFAIFAPIQLCSFGRTDIGWVGIDTWGGRDTGVRQDASASILEPTERTIVEPGEVITFVGTGDFVGAFPDQIATAWTLLNPSDPTRAEPFCSGVLDESLLSACTFTIPADWEPDSYRFLFEVTAPWGQTQEAMVTLTIEGDDLEPTGPPTLNIGSPPVSSSWSESSVVPFVATLRAGETPLEDARVVWEVEGLQVSALTARTDNQGTVVTAAAFSVGPHEALATVFVNDEPVTASTRFIVTQDQDPDSDSDSDSDSESGAEL